MKAMVLHSSNTPLALDECDMPEPGASQIRIRVSACGVCRTDLHIVDGELTHPKLPLIPGHEVVGTVDSVGDAVQGFDIGERVGIPWLGHTCGQCEYCLSGRENLCNGARFTGYDIDGGYAEYAVADSRFCFSIKGGYSDSEAAPLLCAGLIGYRSLKLAGEGEHIGIYGFGAAAHLICQVAVNQGRRIYAFTRPGDKQAQAFAVQTGAVWAGDAGKSPPAPLDSAIIFAPVGELVPMALGNVRKGGVVVCGGIHMSAIPSFPYALLWGERHLRSVANLTREDAVELLDLVARDRIDVQTHQYPLKSANRALDDLREGRLSGAAVLLP